MSVKTFAAIDVGSFELTMKIFDLSGKNTMREIDCIRQRIDLGSDTYAHGKISNEKIDDLCHTLKEFAQIMESYKVTAYKAYGTSAIRETENTLILQDQIEQRTGIWVETLSNSEQRFLDYKSIASKGETFRRIIEEKTAILDIGGGSIQISLFDKDTLVSTQNLRLGVLRLQELLNHLNAGSTQMERLVDELATAQLDDYKKLYLKDREIKNIIIVDDYLSPWAVPKAHERGEANAVVDRKAFSQLMEALRTKGTTELAKRMDIAEEKVPLVYISAILTRRIAELMGAELVWAPGVTLCDDPVTTTDELIPSGETSSYRSNPLGLAEFTLSRKDPQYVGRAKEIQKAEKERMNGGHPCQAVPVLKDVMGEVKKQYPDASRENTGFGSTIFAVKPGDGSAREQAASCQKVLGGWANIANEYATKRYRSNLINWGMLPFLIQPGDLPFKNLDYLFIPSIKKAVEDKAEEIKAYVVTTGEGMKEFTLKLGELTDEERQIILKGCLINYNRV